jgi:cellulose synthase/poly-beta-1,6-N-acetylglucosamine synthase-like glycosyltransferase
VNDPLPSVTIIVPTRPGQTEIHAVAASRGMDYARERLEVIVARGRQPAIQRNTALREARGDLVYFLDDDSQPAADNLRRAVPRFAASDVQMVGGPNLCPPDAPWLEQVFGVVLSSWLAFGPSRARYAAVGALRETSEKELILCNLLARRDALVQVGGFDESLYPNEENALMDELQRRGAKLLYDPALIVHRRPRPTLAAFARMLLTYGRGRAEQFRLHPTLGSALNFVPPLFCVYLLVGPWLGWLGLAPLALYGVALCIQTALSALSYGPILAVAALPLVVLTHLLYGLGFGRGLFTRPGRAAARQAAEVTLERITF